MHMSCRRARHTQEAASARGEVGRRFGRGGVRERVIERSVCSEGLFAVYTEVVREV